MARVLSSVHATSTACSVCWTSLCAACLYIITRPDSFHEPDSSQSMSLQSAFRHHEQAKKRECDERVCEVEHAPPCAVSTGSFGCEATTFYKSLADLVSSKQQKHYSSVTSWLRCRLSIAILRSAVMCVGGSRSCHYCLRCEVKITLPSSEGLPMYCNQKLSHQGFYFYSLYVPPPSFLFAALFRGTVPVYTCVLFSFCEHNCSLNINQCFDQQNTTHSCSPQTCPACSVIARVME